MDKWVLSPVMTVALLSCAAQAAEDAAIYDIPRLDKIAIDGKADDWGRGGFRIEMLLPVGMELKAVSDHDARLRLGWNEQGLLVLAQVQDDQWIEYAKKEELWRWDSMEVFLSPRRGSADVCQWVLSPGMDPQQPEVRYNLHDFRRDPSLKNLPAEPVVARTKEGNRCTIEALLPWSALKIKPKPGREVGVQIWVDDADDRPEYTDYHAAWHPSVGAHMFYDRVQRVRLSERPSPPVLVAGSGAYDTELLRTKVSLAAQADCAGKTVTLVDRVPGQPDPGGKRLTSVELEPAGAGRAAAQIGFPMPVRLDSGGPIEIQIDGKPAGAFLLPEPARMRAVLLAHAGVKAEPSVFEGERLPPVAFERPLWIEGLIGPYQITSTYYDRDYNVVTSAQAPGRYGAVAEIVTGDGRKFRRFVTLFRRPDELNWWRDHVKARLEWPADCGIAPQTAAAFSEEVADFIKEQIEQGTRRNSQAAVLLAGLSETKGDVPKLDFYDNPEQLDRQWWVGLKRKLYGWDQRWPEPFICPRPFEGPPAPVVREGTLAEAGMKPDAAQKIDALLTEWAADTDEAFAVCIVRHGVIVLHKAYGTRDGQPMTVTTPSWMASTTKMLSGVVVMLAVEQGRLDLDSMPGEHLPPLKGIATHKPLTIRHLYLRIGGMEGQWVDSGADMEERITSLFPFYRVEEKYEYGGVGMALACKIVEAVSGESLPNFYRNHLLDPLGCAHTTVADAGSGARSVPLDFARVCQMLLNRGAYGNLRFMSEETFQQMLPRPLAERYGPQAAHWSGVGLQPGEAIGIGTKEYREGGLSDQTFGMEGASKPTIRMDPVNDLVIIMTRNAHGKNYDKYHPRFIQAITEGIEK